MRRGLVRSAAVVAYVAWSAKNLGCDPSTTANKVVDTDGDGLSDIDEKTLYGTSPVLADTDGDGMTDQMEIVVNAFDPVNAPLRFNPRVADVPAMDILITGAPMISLVVTEANGETRTFETTHTQGVDLVVSDSTTQTNAQTDTVGQSVTRTSSVTRQIASEVGISDLDFARDAGQPGGGDAGRGDAGAGDAGGGDAGNEPSEDQGGPVMVTLSNGVASTADRSSTSLLSISFTHAQSRAIREALTRAEAYTQSHEVATSGGVLGLLAVIVNRGNLPFRVTNLVLSASLVTADGIEAPVGNLDIRTVYLAYQPYSLAPGEQQGPVNFEKAFLNLDAVAAILRDLQGLTVRVGIYELSDAAGKPYVFNLAAIRARTATVSIDYGSQRPPERHLVATNLDPASPGVSAQRALEEILRIPIQCDPDGGLTSIRNVVGDSGGSGQWIAYHRHNNGSNVMTTPYVGTFDCARIVLRAGDVLRLIRVEQ